MIDRFPITSAIIIGTNERQWLFNCLDSLLKSNYPSLEIIFIDNASSDESSEFVKKNFPKVKVIKSELNKGFAGANNIGMRYAFDKKSKYVFLVNPDTISSCDLVSKLVEFMERNSTFGIVGPIQADYYDSKKLNAWSNHALENQDKHVFHHWNNWKPNIANKALEKIPNILEHAYVQGAAFFLRQDVIMKVGYFEETYHTFYEEVDLCRKARWAGYRVALLLDVSIQHFGGGGSIKNSLYRNYHYSRNKYLYLITDPEYSHSEVFKLSVKWFVNDFKGVIKGKGKDISSIKQFAQIFFWLAVNSRKMINIRKNNKKLVTFLKLTQNGS